MKTLVAYFSYSGDTERAAKVIAETVGADLFRIEPKIPYSVNYNACVNVAQEEKRKNIRPAMKNLLTQNKLDEYDTIFIGYPIWWYDGPMIIYTFLESLDFSGKKIVPFALSGGSGLCGSDKNIVNICKEATVKSGTMLNHFSAAEIAEWAKNI